jgi:hydroxyacylglutathione hydrolase
MPSDVAIARFTTGPIETNTYVVSDEFGAALVFDPSAGCGPVLEHCRRAGLSVEAIVLTHGHFDHLLGIDEIRAVYEVDAWVHPSENALVRQPGLNGSDILGMSYYYAGPLRELVEGPTKLAGIGVTVLHVPGHSPGGCAFVFGGDAIVGDALFAGSVGRADLPGGDFEQLIASIKTKLMTLPPSTVVWPGHGNRTTIAREARMNPFLA